MTWEMTVGTEEPVSSQARKKLKGTRQQEDFWAQLCRGSGSVLLEARAGTGKSTSCREGMWRLFETVPSLAIRYCCFNRKIADEFAERCPPFAEVNTMHGFALRAMGRCFGSKIDNQKTYTVLDQIPGGATLKRYHPQEHLDRRRTGQEQWVLPDRSRPQEQAPGSGLAIRCRVLAQDGEVIDWAIEVLKRSAEMTSIIDFDDMLWLAVLHQVRFPSLDFLFIDETQDLNILQHELAALMCPDGRIIAVGDPYQCQPAGTMVLLPGGERKPIEAIREGDEVVSFTRHGSALVGRERNGKRITATACRHFDGDLLKVAAGNKETECTPQHKWITRFITRDTYLWVTYLMRRAIVSASAGANSSRRRVGLTWRRGLGLSERTRPGFSEFTRLRPRRVSMRQSLRPSLACHWSRFGRTARTLSTQQTPSSEPSANFLSCHAATNSTTGRIVVFALLADRSTIHSTRSISSNDRDARPFS